METVEKRPSREEETGYGRKVHSKGRYSGLPPGGPCSHCGSPLPWPELLIGTKEIAAFMRVHPKTLNRWINDGRFPAAEDGKGRWMITRRVIGVWLLERRKGQMQQMDDRRQVQREARRQIRREVEKERRDRHCLYCGMATGQPHARDVR